VYKEVEGNVIGNIVDMLGNEKGQVMLGPQQRIWMYWFGKNANSSGLWNQI